MTQTLSRNFFGKWFGKAKSIVISETALTLIDVDQKTKTIPVNQLIDFPAIEKSFFGYNLIIKTQQEASRIWGISSRSAQIFNNESTVGLNKAISSNITRHIEAFYSQAISQYLRDSSVTPLDEHVTPFIKNYKISKKRWKEILSTPQLSKIDVISRMPDIKNVERYRQYYEHKIINDHSDFFDGIEANPLTQDQRLAVIRNNDKNLILAAAGTGKTSVIVAKVLHLMTHSNVLAKNILVLAYNNAAAKELKERMEERKKAYGLCCESPRIMTFHALGLKILKEVEANTALSVFANDSEQLEQWFSRWLIEHLAESTLTMQQFIVLAYPYSTFLGLNVQKDKIQAIEKLISENEKIEDIVSLLKSSGVLAENIKRYIKCLQVIKVEQLTCEQIESKLQNAKIDNAKQYAQFLNTIMQAYTAELKNQSAIDFDDMITNAFGHVTRNEFIPQWSDILVDEFQDISIARMNLLNEIISKGPRPKLTVVGDDWQSIYRFSGSKLALITQFEKFSGKHSLTTLQKTFRYNNSIAKTAGQFVMQNPEQYNKNIEAHKQVEQSQIYLLDSHKKGIDTCILEVVKSIKYHDPTGKIAILGRYRYLLNNAKAVLIDDPSHHNIHYWTFHSSKGLEADYCIIVGLYRGKTGFPSNNKEDLIVEALLPETDNFKYSEERRLLYVAMTRAKKKVYLISDSEKPSAFIEELLSPGYDLQIMSGTFDNLKNTHYP